MTDDEPLRRGDVVVAHIAAARGVEIRKQRPYVVVSPDDQNAAGLAYILVPMTTGAHPYHFRVACALGGRQGHAVIEQVRMVDASRVRQRVGRLPPATTRQILTRLSEMFEE